MTKDDRVFVIMSVRLSNGHFESSISVPLDADQDEKQDAIDKWLQMMLMGIKWNVLELRAEFPEGASKTGEGGRR